MDRIIPEKAYIAWTPVLDSTLDHPTRGKIEVRKRSANYSDRHWTDLYLCTGGADTTYHVEDAKRDPKGYAYRWFIYLTTEYNMDPKIVAAELSKIDGFNRGEPFDG